MRLRCSEAISLVQFIITPLLANIWYQCLLPHCMGYTFCMDTLILVSFFVHSCSPLFQRWWGVSICHLAFGAHSWVHSHLYHEHFLEQISYFLVGWDIHGEGLVLLCSQSFWSIKGSLIHSSLRSLHAEFLCYPFHLLLHTLLSSPCKTLPAICVYLFSPHFS